MAKYDDTNRGKLNPNKRKTEDKHPDKRGTINIDGLWYWISAWEVKTSNGSFENLAVTIMTQDEVDHLKKLKAEAEAKKAQGQQPQQKQQQQAQQQTKHTEHNTDGSVRDNNEPPMDFDDDIPF